MRLDWSAIDLRENFVKLPASITKTKQGRHIEISENCRAWFMPHSGQGRIFPHSENVLRDRLAELREKHNVPTIKHGTRHAFASFWLAQHGDINQLCRFLGHDDPQTTFKHYAKAATAREAKKFWAIMPKKKRGEKILEFSVEGGGMKRRKKSVPAVPDGLDGYPDWEDLREESEEICRKRASKKRRSLPTVDNPLLVTIRDALKNRQQIY